MPSILRSRRGSQAQGLSVMPPSSRMVEIKSGLPRPAEAALHVLLRTPRTGVLITLKRHDQFPCS